MKHFILCLFALLICLQSYADNQVINRVKVKTVGLANPERGFRFEIKIGNEKGESVYIDHNWPFPYYHDDGITMSQAYCYLTPYCNTDSIPQSKLDALQADFNKARQDGVKFVLRFAYQFRSEDQYPSLNTILGHIKQLTPLIRKNIDVIYTLQTGWVGLWGEFHSDPNHISKDPQSVLKILQATLEMLPDSRKTMMRRMAYRDMAQSVSNDSLDVKRIGFFNDGTLANYTDGGTFARTEDGESEFDKVTRESADLPIDGELFWSSVKNLTHANAISALDRLIKHHYTTLSVVHSNGELDPSGKGSIDAWKATPFTAEMIKSYGLPCDENYFKHNPELSAYEYIRDHLGYRLEVISSDGHTDKQIYRGSVTIRNVGFARPINPRKVYLVLYNDKGEVYEFPTDADAHSFVPWKEVRIKLEGKIPSKKSAEEFKAALWLPDESTSIRYRAEYAITIAEGTTPCIIDGRLLNTIQ